MAIARPSGSLVNLTFVLFFDQRQHLFLDESRRSGRSCCRIPGRARCPPQVAAADFPMETAIITGTLCSAIRLSSTVNNSRSGPIGSYGERRDGAGNILFRDT